MKAAATPTPLVLPISSADLEAREAALTQREANLKVQTALFAQQRVKFEKAQWECAALKRAPETLESDFETWPSTEPSVKRSRTDMNASDDNSTSQGSTSPSRASASRGRSPAGRRGMPGRNTYPVRGVASPAVRLSMTPEAIRESLRP
ncbi:hypothetical protein MSAN_02032000 [Mycena sanguinolenta]|uniref:Uncharacterized protein n=1 Tax=Mycena sanguinolenta TaxID=230812 RepID=A0A8H6XHU0_9AGAR|nr:hypothetical protein MSAN_02032000 [Mycena sanguinolenta]